MRYIISSALSIVALGFAPSVRADVPFVITDIPPIYALTAQVMGDLGAPVLLLAKGADEHDFQLRPSQMRDIAQADLAVWIGPELTPWLDRALSGGKEGMVSLPLLGQDGTILMDYDPDHSDDGATEPHQNHDDHGHDVHSGVNPHAWMEPQNAILWLDQIADQLSRLDGENASVYGENAMIAKTKIAQMDAQLAVALAPVRDRAFVTYHDAYGYFVAHYGLRFAGSIAMGDATTAGAAHIQQLQSTIAKDVVCVFPEAQHDSELLLQLLDGTSVRAGRALDPVGSTFDAGQDTYDVLMRSIAESLANCLSGA